MSAPIIWMSIGAGKPKFRICETMSAGWKKNSTPGKRAGSSRRRRRDVVRSRMMMFGIQRDQNFSIARADHARAAIGKIDARVGNADVIEHRLQFVLWESSSRNTFST